MKTRILGIGLVAASLVLQLGAPALPTWAAEAAEDSETREIMGLYLALPYPERETVEARQARLEVLARLSRASDALAVIRGAWPAVKDSRQRAELAEIVGRQTQTPAAAAMLTEWLKDPAEDVRWQAVHGLRLMARRTDRTGGSRIVRGSDHPPKVEGLVPALISAANDPSEKVRLNAMYALADTRAPQATEVLRKHLQDPSREVRLAAACFLTEFGDASGLPEMTQALERLQTADPEQDSRYYSEAEMILASLQRITGKSLGEIPMNPGLSSNIQETGVLRERYRTLVSAWSEFLSSEEGKRLLQTLKPAEPAPEGADKPQGGSRKSTQR